MTTTSQKSITLLEAVKDSLAQAARYNRGDAVAPVAVLWTDADAQWRPVVEQLRGLMPELLTLGEYNSQMRTGPAIWLRCMIEPKVRKEKIPELQWPDDAVPVIYIPGVSRQTLFVREDEVENAWRLYTPLLAQELEVHPYPAGSWGPAAAEGFPRGTD